MKKDIGTYEAKTRLPELLREVRSGYSFTITKHGKPIADLVPSAATPDRDRDRSAAVAGLKALMHDDPIPGVDIRQLIDHGRA